MRYRGQNVFHLLLTPAGRGKFFRAWNYLSFPLFLPLARFHRRFIAKRTRIVSVVGSMGKTTTTRAVEAALALPQLARDNKNSWSDVAFKVLRLRPATERAVMEVGIAKPGQMERYAMMLRPQITVVTTIGSEHNRSLPTLEVTRAEKAGMVRVLAADGVAVLNGDDANVLWMQTQTRARVVTYGFDAANDVRGEDYVHDWPQGSSFTLHIGAQSWRVRSRLMGRHQAYPLLAAMAVALVEGADLSAAVARLEALQPEHGRMEQVRLENGAWMLGDDYKSPLESMHAALGALAQIPARRRIVVFGGITEPAGNQHRLYRELGMHVGQSATRAVFVGAKKMEDMARGAVRAGLPRESITLAHEMNVLEVAELLRVELAAGDVVLVKGRSNERLRRIILKLQGRPVRCTIKLCHVSDLDCDRCPMLERGWKGLRVAT